MYGRALLAAVFLSLVLRVRTGASAEHGDEVPHVGSQQASIEARPYLLSLHHKQKGHICAASLVSRQWLLTAAHCVYEGPQLGDPTCYFVVGGITDLTGCFHDLSACVDTKGAQIGQPKLFVVNPKYDVSKLVGNDLALMMVRRRMNLGKQVNVVALPRTVLDHAALRSDDTICSVMWWRDEKRDRVKRLLYAGELPLLDVQECSRKLELHLQEDEHLCTYAPEVKTCGSDAGSPLVCDGILVGVVSIDRPGLHPVCNGTIPRLYERVDTHVRWLQRVTSAAAAPPPPPSLYWTLCLPLAINYVFT